MDVLLVNSIALVFIALCLVGLTVLQATKLVIEKRQDTKKPKIKPRAQQPKPQHRTLDEVESSSENELAPKVVGVNTRGGIMLEFIDDAPEEILQLLDPKYLVVKDDEDPV